MYNVGQRYYIIRPGKHSVEIATIKSMTTATVELDLGENVPGYNMTKMHVFKRYAIDDVRFLELIEEKQNELE